LDREGPHPAHEVGSSDSDALRESVAAVAECLNRDLLSVVDDVVAGIRGALANDGAHATDIPLEEHRASALAAAERVVGIWLEGGSFTVDDIGEEVRRMGARRARQGLSLGTLQLSAAVARDILWAHTVACAEHLPVDIRGPVVAQLARDVFRLGDEVIAAIDRGHAQGRSQESSSFFAQLLTAEVDNAHALSLQAPALGIDLDQPRGLLVLVMSNEALSDVARVANRLANELVGCDFRIEAGVHPHAGVVVETGDEQRWADQRRRAAELLAGSPAVAVAAGPVRGVSAMRGAYADTLAVAPVTLAMERQGSVVTIRELRLHRLLVDVDRELQERFVEETVGSLLKLPGDVRDRLVSTLRALDISGGRLVTAAKALGVSEQTVRNRLATIRSVVDPDVRPDELAVALCLVDVLGAP